MFVRSRDHINKNVTAQYIRDKKREFSATLDELNLSDVDLRALMSSAALTLHRMKGIHNLKLKNKHQKEDEGFIYEYNGICVLPKKLVVKKYNEDDKSYHYDVFETNRSVLKNAQSLSTRNEGYKFLT